MFRFPDREIDGEGGGKREGEREGAEEGREEVKNKDYPSRDIDGVMSEQRTQSWTLKTRFPVIPFPHFRSRLGETGGTRPHSVPLSLFPPFLLP